MSNTRLYDQIGAFAVVPIEFIDHADQFSDQARWLFVLLRRYINNESGKAFPSYALITERTGWTNKTIAKAIKELESGGWIIRQKQFSGPTIYTLTRPQNVPQGTTVSSSHREQTQFPQGTTVVPVGTSNKINNKQINNKQINVVISQETTPVRPHTPQGIDPVAIALEAFPMLPIYHQETIEGAGITQSHLWRKAVEDWRSNRYSPRNITGLVDSYYRLEKQEAREKEYQTNGQNGISNRTTTRTTAGERKAGEYLALQRKLGENASNDPDYKPLPGFEWLESIR